MYKNYLEFFYALVNFYNGTTDHGQESREFMILEPPVELLENAPFKQIEEACSEDDFKSPNRVATRQNEGPSSDEMIIDGSLNTLTIKDFLYISMIVVYFLVTKWFISKRISNSVSNFP